MKYIKFGKTGLSSPFLLFTEKLYREEVLPLKVLPVGKALRLKALRDFELTYAAYNEFQRGMERYWCLRWLGQEGDARHVGRALMRENMVRFETIPLFLKVPSLPPLDTGSRVLLEVERIDLLESDVRCRYVETLAAETLPEADQTEAEEE